MRKTSEKSEKKDKSTTTLGNIGAINDIPIFVKDSSRVCVNEKHLKRLKELTRNYTAEEANAALSVLVDLYPELAAKAFFDEHMRMRDYLTKYNDISKGVTE